LAQATRAHAPQASEVWLPPVSFAMAAPCPCQSAGRLTARRGNRAAPLALLLACAALWCCRPGVGGGFLAGRSVRQLPSAVRGGSRAGLAKRADGYTFEVAKSDGHQGLVVEEQEEPNTVRVFTMGSDFQGNYNTVLGDKPLPASGRAYWEVKIVKKPLDSWEYIGVVEPAADVTVPMTRNKKAATWCWGSTWESSFMYTYLAMRPSFNEAVQKLQRPFLAMCEQEGFPMKEIESQVKEQVSKPFMGVDGTTVGTLQEYFPTFESGLVVGVEVNMDDGSMAFWADGKYLGKVKDTDGKPVNLKGKKVVPAVSIYGRKGGMPQHTIMELRTGLEPPPMP